MMRLETLRTRHARQVHLLLLQALKEADWRLGPAADLLGIPIATLQHMVERSEKLTAERERRRAERLRKSGHWHGGRPEGT